MWKSLIQNVGGSRRAHGNNGCRSHRERLFFIRPQELTELKVSVKWCSRSFRWTMSLPGRIFLSPTSLLIYTWSPRKTQTELMSERNHIRSTCGRALRSQSVWQAQEIRPVISIASAGPYLRSPRFSQAWGVKSEKVWIKCIGDWLQATNNALVSPWGKKGKHFPLEAFNQEWPIFEFSASCPCVCLKTIFFCLYWRTQKASHEERMRYKNL